MSRLLYSLIFYLLLPVILLRLCYRAWRAPAYRRRIAERFGFIPDPGFGACIWVHAVSVGETIAAAPMIRRLMAAHPELPMVVTTMTPTGSERVRALFGDSVYHVYAPYDLPDALARFLKKLKPRALVIMETEIWPNTVAACHRRGIPVVLANARLSERSARGYARLSALTRKVFGQFAAVVAQSGDDAGRFEQLGVADDHLVVSGSIKFDISIAEEVQRQAQLLKSQWSEAGQRPVWIVASTHEGEDELVLDAFARLRERLENPLLILVPRHPERFDPVAKLVLDRGYATHRRSGGDVLPAGTQVLLVDTMGELLMLFGCADVATLGGSFVERGGHNSLEAAAWALPIVNGPSSFNFAEITRLLQEAGALKTAGSAAELAAEVAAFLADEDGARRAGEAARTVVDANRGALDRLLTVIDQQLQ